jgi:hypothetical protein
MVVCRSKSGGAHVFVFFKEDIKATLVVKKMAAIAKAMGYGGSEIFPKQTSVKEGEFGNWLNMPYFDWEISSRYAYDDKGKRLELPDFLKFAEKKKITIAEWKKVAVPDVIHPFEDGPPCLLGMARAKIGEGGRNVALLQFGVYAKNKYEENEYQDKIAEYNAAYFTPPLGMKEMNDTVFKSLDRRDYGYLCTQQPQVSFCNRTACLRRRYGIGGAADDEFEQQMEMDNLRQLVYFTPAGDPIDDKPEWELTVQGRVIRFKTLEIKNQNLFAEICINKLKIWPPPLPQPRWRNLIQHHLNTCETVEIPFETSAPAQTLEELKLYIASNAHAKSNLDLMNGLVLKTDTTYRFRLESFVEYLRDKSRGVVVMKTIADHLQMMKLTRTKTTARVGQDHLSIVCWEIDHGHLEYHTVDKIDEVETPKSEF